VLLQLTPAGHALKTRALRVPPTMAAASGCERGELTRLTARLKALRTQLTTSLPGGVA